MIRHGPNCLEGPFARTSFLQSASQTSEPKTAPDTSSKSTQSASTPPENTAMRWDLVERVRQEIAAGTYETPEKWEAALEQLFRRAEQ
jgi:negative regulator of flagellin synthesis FlgM